MAFVGELEQRLGNGRLIQLTNDRDTKGATTIDTVRQGHAIDDMKVDFKTYVQTVFDDTDDDHIRLGVRGVEIILQIYKGTAKIGDLHKAWTEQLRAFSRIGPRARLIPETTSELTPADEVLSGEIKRPDSDINDDQWEHLTLEPPVS